MGYAVPRGVPFSNKAIKEDFQSKVVHNTETWRRLEQGSREDCLSMGMESEIRQALGGLNPGSTAAVLHWVSNWTSKNSSLCICKTEALINPAGDVRGLSSILSPDTYWSHPRGPNIVLENEGTSEQTI